MKIHLLGTGGADGVPGLFSGTRVSQHARRFGGKDVRTRSAALIDDGVKVDLGPDSWHQMARDGLDARDWCGLFFTPADADHFAIEELQYVLYPFNDEEYAGFTLFGNNAIVDALAARYPDWPFDIVQTRSFEPVKLCEYRVTPIKAKHGSPDEDTQNLIFERDGKSLLYATDTGIWEEPTWEFLGGVRLDGLVLECTEAFVLTPYNGHLDFEEFGQVLERLRKLGTVHDGTQIVSTHHSHNGDATHDELVEALGPLGVIVGYDGLTVEI